MDYDDYDDQNNPTFRWVSVIVLLMAVTGFMSLAWYAYQTGSDHVTQEADDVIEAASTPIKEKPADAGGAEFPHQDKTIYNVIDGEGENGDVTIVKAPEKPVKEEVLPEEDVQEMVKIEEKVEEEEMKEEPKAPSVVPVKGSQSADKKIAEILKKAMDDSKKSADAEIEKEVPKTKAPDPFAPVKTEAEVEKSKVAAPVVAASSNAQVQLGAYGSEAEARMNWDKIKGKNADVLSGLEPSIIRADLGAKGVFYRLRAKGFASSAKASETCAVLTSRSLGCFVVQ